MHPLSEKVSAIIDPNLPLVSNLSNVSAVLNELEDINWVGFYLVGKDYLYLGPFQGEVACTTMKFDKGVGGYAYQKRETVIVPNVHKFKGHIACSSLTNSEIVTPIIKNLKVEALIDIDSTTLNRFSEKEKQLLEEVAKLLSPLF